MSEVFTETEVLTEDVENLRKRVQEALGTLTRLPEVEKHFQDLSHTYEDWKEHVDAWPPLEDDVEAVTAACTAVTKACKESVATLEARFGALREELEVQIARRVDTGLGSIRGELFDVVDNAKADFQRRLDQHRGAMESEIAALRRQDDELRQALGSFTVQTAAGLRDLDTSLKDLRRSTQQRVAELQARDTDLEGRAVTLNRQLSTLRLTLWIGLVGAIALSVALSRVLFH